MKLLITAGHNWWVVMPNFVIQEPSLERDMVHPMVRGPLGPVQGRFPRKTGRMSS